MVRARRQRPDRPRQARRRLIGGSSALLAEAAHSFADTTSQLLLLVSLKLGSAKPDEEHPFGHGKELFWAFVVAVSIFVAGGFFSIAEGVWSLLQPPGEGRFAVTFGVLLFALVAERIALVRAVVHVRADARAEKEPFFSHVRKSKDPTPKVVLFEDSAAVSGVVIALVVVVVAEVTDNHVWDAGAAIAIGALLIVTGLELGRETKGLLIGEPPQRRSGARSARRSSRTTPSRSSTSCWPCTSARGRSSSTHASISSPIRTRGAWSACSPRCVTARARRCRR